ncbi:MAG: flagellar hook-associated protein FlgL [Firmicutes bacterium]|nr:flagellar hook-associated protein FlgL [Bacillota bacterium]
MRVTDSMLTSGLMSNLYANLKTMSKYQNQIITERKILRLSDDPIGAVKAMQIDAILNANEQYDKNISDATAWLDQMNTALMDMNEVVMRAKDLAVQAASGTYSQEQRDSISQEVKELQSHFVNLANTKFMGKYIFGGFNTTATPFSVNDGKISYNSIDDLSSATKTEAAAEANQIRQCRLSDSITFDVGINGVQIMGIGADNIFNVFQSFNDFLTGDNTSGNLSEFTDKFSAAQDSIMTHLADVGGKQIRVDLITQQHQSAELNLYDTLNKVAGIDKTEVITQYEMTKNAYNAALQVGARIIQLSLVDFLR